MDIAKSPLAPKVTAELPDIEGVSLYTFETGLKYTDRPDLFLSVFDESVVVAGVFTKSTTCAPSILWNREKLKGKKARALIVNAGNANAFTGEAGIEAVHDCVEAVANYVGCDINEIFVSSTGVIGEKLETEKITSKITDTLNNKSDWPSAAKAITTTDTFIKMATAKSGDATICGIAKGSGMIEPNMATMLAYIYTDAEINANELQLLLEETNDKSFNSITVDSDTSTSDAVLLFATGKKKPANDFQEKLQAVMLDLAQQIVKDGEGATKFIEVEVTGAKSDLSAKIVAKAIANSPLVKTAIAGEDANWGRIVMAVGKTEEPADRDNLTIKFGDYTLTYAGAAAEDYDEAKVTEYIKGEEIKVSVDLGIDQGTAKVWTCDLTHGYISINADYRS